MRLRRPIAFILSAAVAASALTGCDSFSGHAAAAANSAQVQQLIEFIADLGLERDLRQALQKGGDLRQVLLTLLGLENAVNFNVDGLTGARPGQHAVQVWEVTAQSAEDAAALAASQIRAVLEQLKSSGVTEGRIGMVEVDGKYYVVVDVEVTEENTFEPIRPASDDDDDSEDDTIPGVTVDEKGLLTIDVAELGLNQNNITADTIISTINENAEEQTGETSNYTNDSIKDLDLSGCANLKNIEGSAFYECTSLTKITLPAGLESIGNVAFGGCQSLTSINLSDCTSLKSIGNSAFGGCTILKEINLNGCTSLERIYDNAFANSGLTEINLSGCTSLQSISTGAFGECKSLTSINLSGCTKLTTIGISAFFGCSKLTEIDLSNTKVDTINDTTFFNCSGLKTVKLPAKLTTISGWAFQGCSSLEKIYFYGTAVPTIGTNAFDGVNAEGLTIHCPSSIKDTLQQKLIESESFTADDFKNNSIKFEDLDPLTYLLGL